MIGSYDLIIMDIGANLYFNVANLAIRNSVYIAQVRDRDRISVRASVSEVALLTSSDNSQ